MAALITNHTYFSLPVCGQYTRDIWRADLKRLIRDAGFNSQETVIYISAKQLHRFA